MQLHSVLARTSAAGAAVAALAASAAAQTGGPAPLESRTAGLLVADLQLDKVFFTKDRNGDGDALDPGEVSVYFDDTNSSGNLLIVENVFSMFQSRDGSIYIGEGSSDSVIRLFDRNGDNDAQDLGEASVFFASGSSDPNAFLMATPNGIWEDPAGFIYVVTAGTSTAPDAVYRLKDLNGDGDAHDLGEATLYFNLQTLVPSSSAFGCAMIGSTLYIADLVGGDPDVILRAADADMSGSIAATEFNTFISDSNLFGVQVGFGITTDGSSIYTVENASSQDQNVWRLTDGNGSNDIDQATEATAVWNEAGVPAPFLMGNCTDLAFGPGSRLAVPSGGVLEADNVFVLTDLTGDGDYMDAGETAVWVAGDTFTIPLTLDQFVDNPRAVEFIRCSADVDNSGVTDVFDLLAFLDGWFVMDADWNEDGLTDVFDLLGYLDAWFNACA